MRLNFLFLSLMILLPASAVYLDSSYYNNLKLISVEGTWEWAGTGSNPGHAIGKPDALIVRLHGGDGVSKLKYQAIKPFNIAIVNLAEIRPDSPNAGILSAGAVPQDEAIYVSKDCQNWEKVPWSTSNRTLIIQTAPCMDVTNNNITDYCDIYQVVLKLKEPYNCLMIADEVGGDDSIEVDSAGAVPAEVGHIYSNYILEVNGVSFEGLDQSINVKAGETITFKVYEKGSGFFGLFKNYVGGVDIYSDEHLIGRIPDKGKILFWDNPFDAPSFTYVYYDNGSHIVYGIKDGIKTTGGIINVDELVSGDLFLSVINKEPYMDIDEYQIVKGTTLQFKVLLRKPWGWFEIGRWINLYEYVPVKARIYDITTNKTLIGESDENGNFNYTFNLQTLYKRYLIRAEYEGKASNTIKVSVYENQNLVEEPVQDFNVTGERATLEVLVGAKTKEGSLVQLGNAMVYFYVFNQSIQDYELLGRLKTDASGKIVKDVPAKKQLKIEADAEGYKRSNYQLLTLLPGEIKKVTITLEPLGKDTPCTEYYINARSKYGEPVIPAGEKITFWISKDAPSSNAEAGGTLHIINNNNGEEINSEKIPEPWLLWGGTVEVKFDTPGNYSAYAEVKGERTRNTVEIKVLEQSEFEQYKSEYYVVANKISGVVGETVEVWVSKGGMNFDKSNTVNATVEIYRLYSNGTQEPYGKSVTKKEGWLVWEKYVARFNLIEAGTFILYGDVNGIKTRNSWRLEVKEGNVTDPNALRLAWKLVGSPEDFKRSISFTGGGAALGGILGAIFGGVGAIPGAIIGGTAGYAAGYLNDVIDDWFNSWQFGDAVFPDGVKVEFALIQNENKKSGELYINNELVGVFQNNSYSWTFNKPGEYEIRAYSIIDDEKIETVNSPLKFTIGTATGWSLPLPPIIGVPVLDLFIYILLGLILLMVAISIIRAILGG